MRHSVRVRHSCGVGSYTTIAKRLGVSGRGNRAKLPKCVTDKIAEMYPDEEGTPTKVGYQQDAA